MQHISVIIPLYNKDRQIERCLQSVLAQTRSPHEILIIDDGCTDRSAEKVAAFTDERIRLIQQTNQGVAAARNRGIKEAKGDLIAFLDADDEWKPSFLAAVTDLATRFPGAALCATGCDIVDAKGNTVPQRYAGLPQTETGGLLDDFFISMLHYPPVCASNTLCRRDVFDAVGLFPVGEELAEDWDMWTRIALKYPVAYLPRAEAYYHTETETSAAGHKRFSGEDTALLQTLQTALATNAFPYTRRESVERFMAKHLLEIAKHLLATGSRRKARERIRQAWALHGARMKCIRWWIKSW